MSKKTELLVGITTGLMVVYTIMGALSFVFSIVFFLFMIVSALMIWMVITVLKDTSNLSGKKFDDYFYEDSPVNRDRQG